MKPKVLKLRSDGIVPKTGIYPVKRGDFIRTAKQVKREVKRGGTR